MTPGSLPPRPWRHVDGPVALHYAADRFPHVLDAEGKPVAFVSWSDGDDPAALAKLLAAAPELRDALQEAVRLFETYGLVAAVPGMTCGKWVNAARDALAKAAAS